MSIKPRSKKVSRTDGKASKEAILDATLLIIIRDGMRNVKYKTVAEVAGVAISAPAYYFRDIPALIKEAYQHYFSRYKIEMNEIRSVGSKALNQFDKNLLGNKDTLEVFIDSYTEILLTVIASDHKDSATFMLLDRIFRNETLQNSAMYPALKRQDRLDLESIEDVFKTLGTQNPEEDAVHLMSLMGYLSEKLLHEGYTDNVKSYAKTMLRSLLIKSLL